MIFQKPTQEQLILFRKKLLADVSFLIFSCGCPKESALFCNNWSHTSFITRQGKPDDSSYQGEMGPLRYTHSWYKSVIFKQII